MSINGYAKFGADVSNVMEGMEKFHLKKLVCNTDSQYQSGSGGSELF